MANKAGYEGIIKYGTAGSTAATQLTNVEDLTYDNPGEDFETTTRGDGTAVPHKSEEPATVGAVITWSMFHKTTDTALTALRAAARARTAVAIRTISDASGLGFDGDCYLTVTHETPLKGPSKYNFTAKATDSQGRAWSANV